MSRFTSMFWFVCFCATIPASAQYGAKDGEWRTYGGDLGNTRYSPLNQINASNFSKLQVAWRFSTANLGRRRKCDPLIWRC